MWGDRVNALAEEVGRIKRELERSQEPMNRAPVSVQARFRAFAVRYFNIRRLTASRVRCCGFHVSPHPPQVKRITSSRCRISRSITARPIRVHRGHLIRRILWGGARIVPASSCRRGGFDVM
jgi:hypothetical protein